jgi:hypothetical protein
MKEQIELINPEALMCDGFDDAIIGIAERINLNPVVTYDVEKMLSILIDKYDMSYDEAEEYYHFNILGAWLGENTPIYVRSLNN